MVKSARYTKKQNQDHFTSNKSDWRLSKRSQIFIKTQIQAEEHLVTIDEGCPSVEWEDVIE